MLQRVLTFGLALRRPERVALVVLAHVSHRRAAHLTRAGMLDQLNLAQAVQGAWWVVRLVGRTWRALLRRVGIDAPEPPRDTPKD
jgi:hypothetical protein